MHALTRFVGFVPLLALAIILVALPATAVGKDEGHEFAARLIGINETPSINTDGTATLKLKLSDDKIEFELKYQNLSLAPTVAHIHFGQARVAGGVMVFFCGGGGQPACPSTTAGTVKGTITAANVVGPTAQGIKANDLAAVERAIRAGASYANMHNGNFPSGEIRGQIHRD
jgi:hypothetical protein